MQKFEISRLNLVKKDTFRQYIPFLVGSVSSSVSGAGPSVFLHKKIGRDISQRHDPESNHNQSFD